MKGICVVLFGFVLAVILCSQQAEGGISDIMSMKEEDIDKLAAQFKMTDCWNWMKKEFFGGKYAMAKLLPLASKVDEVVMKVAQEPKCTSAIKKISSMMG